MPFAVLRRHPLALAMLLQFGTGGAMLPFVTLFLRDRGLDVTHISHLFLGASGMLLVFPFFWGMVADRYVPLNRLFVLLNGLIVVSLWWFSVQRGFGPLLVSYMIFYACLNPALVLLNPLAFHHLPNPREDFGALRMWGSVGWMLPSAAVFAVLHHAPGTDLVHTVHLGMALALVMGLLAWFLPHTPAGAAHARTEPPAPAYWPAVRLLLGNGAYVTVLVVYFLVASSFSIQAIYSPLMLEDLGLARAWIGPAQCLGVVLEVFLFRWQRRFVHRFSHAGTILVGAVCLLARHLIFSFSDHLPLLILSHVLTGMVIVFHHIGASLLVNALAPRAVRSTAQTLLVLFGSGLGPMFANCSVGWLTRATGQDLRVVFLFALALAAAGCVILLLAGRRLNAAARH